MALPKEMLDMMVQQLSEKVSEANALGTKIKAETEGIDAKVAAVLADADDHDFDQYRSWVAKYDEKIAALEAQYAENAAVVNEQALAKIGATSDLDIEKATAKFLELRKDVTSYTKAMATFEKDAEILAAAISGIEQVVSLRGGSKSTGTGREKPRMEYISLNGDNLDPSTFSEVAKALGKAWGTKVVAGDIQDAAKTAGDFETFASQSGVSHTFNYEQEVDGKVLTAKIDYNVK